MGLLLLYPIRKALARRRGLGSVGGWFHVHILMGLFGPVLILYHCNFSHGALNANVALWTMIVVAVSGIIGHFVYARVSAGFYGDKRKARDHLDALIVAVRALDALHGACEEMIERLERFETRMLAPRRGVIASVTARVRGTVHRHQFHRELSAFVAACAREQRWNPTFHQQRGRHLHALMKHYMDSVRIGGGPFGARAALGALALVPSARLPDHVRGRDAPCRCGLGHRRADGSNGCGTRTRPDRAASGYARIRGGLANRVRAIDCAGDRQTRRAGFVSCRHPVPAGV